MAGLAGKAGYLEENSVKYPITQWTLNPTCELLEDSNSKSDGKEEWVDGFTAGAGTVDAYYDPDDNDIPRLYPGASVTLKLGLNASKSIDMTAYIEGAPITMPVKGKITFQVNYRATGWDGSAQLQNL
jgi:hypothetical protein